MWGYTTANTPSAVGKNPVSRLQEYTQTHSMAPSGIGTQRRVTISFKRTGSRLGCHSKDYTRVLVSLARFSRVDENIHKITVKLL